MQVSRININVPDKTSKQNNGRKVLYNNQNQSFKGVGTGLDKFALFIANAIENGGLAVSFTLQDMLGTNLPRPIMGLRRNKKENNGEKNVKFAAKELVREMLTGPSMFIIPAGMLAIGKKLWGKTINVPAQAIRSLRDIHAAQPLNAAGNAITKQEFYQNAFAQILKNAKTETELSQATIDTAAEYAKQLIETAANKEKSKKAAAAISSDFSELVKKFAQDPAHTDFTSAALSNNMSANIKDTISYIKAYADDVVVQAQNKSQEELPKFIKSITNNKIIGRFAMNIAMFAAIWSFAQLIPKLYNKAEGQKNMGLKGLMKEETLKDDSINNNDNNAKNKSNPSFGSAASMANAITGKGVLGKFARTMEFAGMNVSYPAMMFYMLTGIIIPRLNNAKDKYDREEILRRDVISCIAISTFAKQLEKGFSKLNENQSGFVLASKAPGFEKQSLLKRIVDYLRPIKGVSVMSTDKIIHKYSNLQNYKEGVKGFCDFISGQGGNLSKVFSLTKESKSIVDSLLQKEGKSIATADNATITEVIKKAGDSEEIQKLIDLFKNTNNPWVKKARTLNARFTALSVVVIVPLFLGFMLPWINEQITKRKFREEHNIDNNSNNNAINFNSMKLDAASSELFGDIINFQK